MGRGVLPLTNICQIALLRNYLLLHDLGDVRYDLLNKVLDRFTAQQLTTIEEVNPRLILQDEHTWHKKLIQDFPLNVNERFTADFNKIRKYFSDQLKRLDYHVDNLDNYLEIFKDQTNISSTQVKFRLPSRLLYHKYKEDRVRKEEEAIFRLRERMQNIAKTKKETEIIHIKEVIPTHKYEKIRRIPGTYQPAMGPNRSRIFQKARHEAARQPQLFRGISNTERVVRPASEPGFHSKNRRTTSTNEPTTSSSTRVNSFPTATTTTTTTAQPLASRQVQGPTVSASSGASSAQVRKLPRNRHLRLRASGSSSSSSSTSPTTERLIETRRPVPVQTYSTTEPFNTAPPPHRPLSPAGNRVVQEPRATSPINRTLSVRTAPKEVNIFNRSERLRRNRTLQPKSSTTTTPQQSTPKTALGNGTDPIAERQMLNSEIRRPPESMEQRNVKRIKLSDYLSMKKSKT